MHAAKSWDAMETMSLRLPTHEPHGSRAPQVLVVDDEPANTRLLHRVIQTSGLGDVTAVHDPREGEEAFARVAPDLVLLDLRMPHVDGFALLATLRAAVPAHSYLPFVVLTGNGNHEDRERALALGASDFIAKPFSIAETVLRMRNLLHARALHLELERQNRWLEQRVEARTLELQESQIEMLDRLARAADVRDDDTGCHTRRVGELAAELARAIGLPEEQVDRLRRAAPLHDLGKIGVPDAVLLKPGALTESERAIIERHAEIGADLLAGSPSAHVRLAEEIARAHHERWDGTGYPHGLGGEAIPLAARIVAIVDVWDALTHARPYRPALAPAEVLAYMRGQSGRHFDPALLQVFLATRMADSPEYRQCA